MSQPDAETRLALIRASHSRRNDRYKRRLSDEGLTSVQVIVPTAHVETIRGIGEKLRNRHRRAAKKAKSQ